MILVLGQSGQLAQAFRRSIPGHEVVRFIGQAEVDLRIPGTADRLVRDLRPKLVINCAAFTAVDKAESEAQDNQRLNADLPRELGIAAKAIGAGVLHFSTDYVYAGEGTAPQTEDTRLAPVNAYGSAKLAGEKALAESGATAICVRISWVYSPFAHNFLKTMLRLGSEKDKLKVVSDQVGSPMSAQAIANLMMKTCVPELLSGRASSFQVFNLSSLDFVSWFEFAKDIFEIGRELGFSLRVHRVEAISSASYPTPAKRPLNSRMSDQKFRSVYGDHLPPWKQSLRECLVEIKKEMESKT